MFGRLGHRYVTAVIPAAELTIAPDPRHRPVAAGFDGRAENTLIRCQRLSGIDESLRRRRSDRLEIRHRLIDHRRIQRAQFLFDPFSVGFRNNEKLVASHVVRSMRPNPIHGIKAFAQQLECQPTFRGQVWPVFRKSIVDAGVVSGATYVTPTTGQRVRQFVIALFKAFSIQQLGLSIATGNMARVKRADIGASINHPSKPSVNSSCL